MLLLVTAGSVIVAARFREQALANGLLAHEKELGKQAERERRQADDERQKAENLVVEMHTCRGTRRAPNGVRPPAPCSGSRRQPTSTPTTRSVPA